VLFLQMELLGHVGDHERLADGLPQAMPSALSQ